MKNHIELDYKLPDLKAKNVEGKRFYEKKTGKAEDFSQIGIELGQILKTKSNNSYKR